jgi:osmoprotectant transport system substrate-binding protein
MRIRRTLALGASMLALLGACSTGGGSSPGGSSALAKLKLGVATDCQTNPVCGAALKSAYNIDVTNATKLAACDTPMAQALKGKTIDVGELCSTQPDIAVNGWVVLDDDKKTQPADNIAPLVRNDYLSKLSDKAGFEKILNDVSAAMDTATLTDLGKQISVDKKDVPVVAKGWLQAKNLAAGANASAGGSAPMLKVGSDGFYEAKLMAEIYAEALEANGYKVDRTGIGIGARKVSAPALESGQFDLKPEYIGSGLAFYQAPAAAASGSPAASASGSPAASGSASASGSPAASFSAGDPAAVAQALQAILSTKGGGITVLNYSPAADQNAFVVRKETADQYKLAKMSDLAQYLQ